jgi:hypothetical protein
MVGGPTEHFFLACWIQQYVDHGACELDGTRLGEVSSTRQEKKSWYS